MPEDFKIDEVIIYINIGANEHDFYMWKKVVLYSRINIEKCELLHQVRHLNPGEHVRSSTTKNLASWATLKWHSYAWLATPSYINHFIFVVLIKSTVSNSRFRVFFSSGLLKLIQIHLFQIWIWIGPCTFFKGMPILPIVFTIIAKKTLALLNTAI